MTSPTRLATKPWQDMDEGDTDLAKQVISDLCETKKNWGTRYAKWDKVDELIGTKATTTGFWNKSITYNGTTLEYSVIRSVRDALRSRLATRRPKVRAFTSGARYTVREKARQTTKFVKGVFNRSDIYTKNHQIFNDVLDYGIGYAKPFEVKGRIKMDRVNPRYVVMDEPENGDPTLWWHFFDCRKSALCKEFPEHEADIETSGIIDLNKDGGVRTPQALTDEWCTVIEAWHCPLDEEGRHVIVVGDATLVDDEWESSQPGIVPIRFFEPSVGYVGDCLVDIIGDIQDRVYYLLARIQDMMDIGGTLKVVVDSSSGLNVEILSNELIQVLKHNGTKGVPIQVISIPAIDPVYFQELDRCEGKAYTLLGLSELWANSEKPAGLTSGKAIAEVDDATSKRFLHIAQKEDAWYVALADSICSLAESISGFKIHVNGEKIAYKDIKLKKDEYDLVVAPVSIVSDTAPGVLQKIIDDSQLDAQIAADQLVLLDSFDHEAYVRQLIAPRLACDKYLDELMYDHKNRGLDKHLDLAYLEKKAVLVYNQAYLAEDEEAMDLILDLQTILDATKEEMQTATQPPQPMPGQAPAGAPPGTPGMAPPPAGGPQPQAAM